MSKGYKRCFTAEGQHECNASVVWVLNLRLSYHDRLVWSQLPHGSPAIIKQFPHLRLWTNVVLNECSMYVRVSVMVQMWRKWGSFQSNKGCLSCVLKLLRNTVRRYHGNALLEVWSFGVAVFICYGATVKNMGQSSVYQRIPVLYVTVRQHGGNALLKVQPVRSGLAH